MPKDLLTVVGETKYPLDAFLFVQRGLDFTVRRTHGEPKAGAKAGDRHVTGKILCTGLRDYAIDQYGLLARTVLQRWRITNCEDFGHIVFAMVEAGLMSKTEDDTLRDFAGVFSFDEAFGDRALLGDKR